VRECQNDEEENREKEQKKVKMEAALFKRHWKASQQRLKESKTKEDKKRQDAYLEKVYKERLAEREAEDPDDMYWDPIEDVLEDNRGSFIGQLSLLFRVSLRLEYQVGIPPQRLISQSQILFSTSFGCQSRKTLPTPKGRTMWE